MQELDNFSEKPIHDQSKDSPIKDNLIIEGSMQASREAYPTQTPEALLALGFPMPQLESPSPTPEAQSPPGTSGSESYPVLTIPTDPPQISPYKYRQYAPTQPATPGDSPDTRDI